MNVFEHKKQEWVNREEPIFIKKIDLSKNTTGWLVIDSIGSGVAVGGIRLGKNVSLEEVKQLAAEMTLKFSFYNRPIGGAKAGIRCPSQLNIKEREDIFYNFGKSLHTLLSNSVYIPGTDMGTHKTDIEQLFNGAGMVIEVDQDPIDSSYYTAVSVFSALKAVTFFKEMELKEARLGIQGLGNVGLKLLQIASEHGIKLVAGSTQHGALYSPNGLDVKEIFDLAKKHGDKFVSYYDGAEKIGLKEFFEKDMDIMCPCAGIYPVNKGNIEQIKAKIIVSGCNVAATEKIEKQLYEGGITYLPGFVCNAGGVLGGILRRYGIEEKERSDFLGRGIQSKVRILLEQAKKSENSPAEIARNIVLKNHEKFTLESKARARMNGKLSISFRLKNHGVTEMLRTILWKLIQRELIVPNYMRKLLVKKLVFDRLFKS
jgi:glutamate dehydrogenase/leucine dehydrogenase